MPEWNQVLKMAPWKATNYQAKDLPNKVFMKRVNAYFLDARQLITQIIGRSDEFKTCKLTNSKKFYFPL